jgi:hypothetical protein
VAAAAAGTSYELDCTDTTPIGVLAAPFTVTLNITPSPANALPTGASFGASGSLTVTLSGGIIAALATFVAGVDLTQNGIGLAVPSAEIGSTDGTATGTYTYSNTSGFPTGVMPTTSSVQNVTWAAGSTTLNGPFTNSDIGMGVAAPGASNANAMALGATIVAVNPGVSATLNTATIDVPASPPETVTEYAPMLFTDNAFNTGQVFKTNGTDGGNASIGVVGASGGFTLVGLFFAGDVTIGGAPGVGGQNCLETGFDAAMPPNPGPLQMAEAAPALPAGAVTPLDKASGGFLVQPGTNQNITPPAAAQVALSSSPPTSSTTTSTSTTSTSTTSTTSPGERDPRACIPFCFGSPPPPTLGTPGTPPPTTSTPSGPTITVDPSTGLTDGQRVTITGTGFPAKDSLVAIQCSPLAATASNAIAECDIGAANLGVKSDASGGFTTSLVVHTGKIGSDPAAVCPPATGNCLIAVSEASASSSVRASADITFAGQPAPKSASALGLFAGGLMMVRRRAPRVVDTGETS